MAVASLPMYDLPAIRDATDHWWRGLARAFRAEGVPDVPDTLSRGPNVRDLWHEGGLLFSQTCGYPLIHDLKDQVTLLATPCYAAEGCDGPNYCSTIVVPARSAASSLADLEGTSCAINRRDSHSGYNVLRNMVAPLARNGRFFNSVTETGNHPDSLRLVAAGGADVAAIDCVTYALMARHEPETATETRVLCRSLQAPGLPYVTAGIASSNLKERLLNGLARAFAEPGLNETRRALMLDNYKILALKDYNKISGFEADSVLRGYPHLG